MRGRYEPSALVIADLGRSPLEYHRSGDVRRLAVVDPASGPAPAGDYYFAAVPRNIYTGKNGRRLKRPRVEMTPGAADGTVAFLDYHEYGPHGIYIDYMKTRRDYQRRGLARRLVEDLIARHPGVKWVHFGKLMNPTMGKIFDETVAHHGAAINFAGHRDY